MTDVVNHPPHYMAHPSGVECITITEHMGFNVGNAMKYLWRADQKGNALEDLKKARWYVEREIAKRTSSLYCETHVSESYCTCGKQGCPMKAAPGEAQR